MEQKIHNELIEFDDIEDLKEFDESFFDTFDADIFRNISKVLNCQPHDIHDINKISAGLTNVSFRFKINDDEYVYRHPGASSGNFTNRLAEYTAQKAAKELGLDKTFIEMDVNSGWKISHFMKNCHDLDYNDKASFSRALKMIKKFHDAKIPCSIHLSTYEEAQRLLSISRRNNPKLIQDLNWLNEDIKKCFYLTELDGYEKTLCHNDTYNVNFMQNSEDICIIDWEYAGVGDPCNDIGSIVCRHNFSDEEVDFIIKTYYGNELTPQKYRHTIAYIAISAWYWFCWSICKDSIGDDFGFYYLESFRTAKKYSKLALSLYKKESI